MNYEYDESEEYDEITYYIGKRKSRDCYTA